MPDEGRESLSCLVCCNFFMGGGGESSPVGSPCEGLLDRRPAMLCVNGHTVCMTCAQLLHESDEPCCPACRGALLAAPILNRTLLDAVELLTNRLSNVPEISAAELTMATVQFASGAFADVYKAKWHSQDVVVKAMRLVPELTKQKKLMSLEANLAIGLHHPNIVRVYGTTTLADTRFAIVMEHAEHGSLEGHMASMTLGSQGEALGVKVSLGVVDGLDYVHSRRVAHRDLKPQNILLCGPEKCAKIADFGVSKVIQTVIANSAMTGTPKYAAPELLQPGSVYGCQADLFSLAVILYEVFSGRQAETGLGTNVMQIMLAVVQGKRPVIPKDFPPPLRDLVSRGWAMEPDKRPTLAEFRKVLQGMGAGAAGEGKQAEPPVKKNVNVTKEQQSAEVAKVAFPLPVMSLKWNTSCEALDSVELRKRMVADIRSKSNMSKIVNESVLCAMEVTPRHLFIYDQRLGAFIGSRGGGVTPQESVNAAYAYNKPIPATPNSNESSPEIIGTQLSMTEILPGQAVLLVGIKGGYIQSLVAQLVGVHGRVVTVTSDPVAMAMCRDRVNVHCPFRNIVSWVQVDDVKNPNKVAVAMQRNKLLFHTIIYCGSTDSFPESLRAVLQPSGNASIMAPVKVASDSLRFQLSQRRDGTFQMKTITDFGVLFEDVH